MNRGFVRIYHQHGHFLTSDGAWLGGIVGWTVGSADGPELGERVGPLLGQLVGLPVMSNEQK
jgi:outer membrane lipoprotein SlyB